MEIVFQKEYLKDLFYNGKTKEKQYRFQPQVVKKYIRVVNVIDSVQRLEDLFRFNSLNFEALQGVENYYSVRVDYHYRLIFFMSGENEEQQLTICNIEELTNHYK